MLHCIRVSGVSRTRCKTKKYDVLYMWVFVHFIQGFIDETFIFEKSIQGAEQSIYCSKRHCYAPNIKRQNITSHLGLLQILK